MSKNQANVEVRTSRSANEESDIYRVKGTIDDFAKIKHSGVDEEFYVYELNDYPDFKITLSFTSKSANFGTGFELHIQNK